MEMAKSSTKKSVRYRQSPVITFLVVAAVIFICVTSIVRATSLHTKSKQLAETEKTMELKVEEAKQEQANLDAQEKYMQTNEYIEDVAKDKLGLVKPDESEIRRQKASGRLPEAFLRKNVYKFYLPAVTVRHTQSEELYKLVWQI